MQFIGLRLPWADARADGYSSFLGVSGPNSASRPFWSVDCHFARKLSLDLSASAAKRSRSASQRVAHSAMFEKVSQPKEEVIRQIVANPTRYVCHLVAGEWLEGHRAF